MANNLTRDQMIASAQGLPYSFLPAGGANDPSGVTSSMDMQPAAPNMSYAMPSVQSDITPFDATLTSEQMRQQMTNLAAPVTTTVAPPPLVGPPSPYAPDMQSAPLTVRDIALGEIERGEAMEKKTTQDIMDAKKMRADANADLAGGEKDKIEVERKKGVEQNKLDKEASELAAAQEKRMQMITEQGTAAAEVQMRRVQSAADEASEASMHNFWADKSSGARVLGILAQAFAGAANGLAGNPSAPTPLDRVIQRDMEMQMQNIQQKNRNVENQRGVLRDLYEKTGSMQQAATAMYLASWKRIERQGAQLNSQFANETATAAMKNLNGLVKQRTADVIDKSTEQLRQQSIQQQQHGENLLAEDERTKAMAGGSQGGENAKIYHIAGTQGSVDKRTYDNFKAQDQGYRAAMAQSEQIKYIMTHAQEIGYAKALAMYNSARSDLLTGLRGLQGTGAALSEQEFKNLEQQLPQLTQSMIPGFSATFARDGGTQMDIGMANLSRHHFGSLDGTIEGVTLDPQDHIYGRHVTNYMNEKARQRAAAQ